MDRNAQRPRAKEVKVEQAKRLDPRQDLPLAGHVAARHSGPSISTQMAQVRMISSQLSTVDCQPLLPLNSQHPHKLNSTYLIENKGSGSPQIATKTQFKYRPFSTLRARIPRTPHSHRARACTVYSERREGSKVEESLATGHFSSRFCHEAALPEPKTRQANQPSDGIAKDETVRAPNRFARETGRAGAEPFSGQTRLRRRHRML